jgi:predicted RNase H-like HicB family nuclease
MRAYQIIVWCQPEGGYTASIPELESCSAFGNTVEEAVWRVEAAKTALMEAARAAHKRMPRLGRRSAISVTMW